MARSAITPTYRIVGPEDSTWALGVTTKILTFRPERDIGPNGKLVLSNLPSGTFGVVSISNISVDGQNVITGSGNIPADMFDPLSQENSIRMPGFSALAPLRVTLVSTLAPAAATVFGATVTPPDRLDVGVQEAAARGRQLLERRMGRPRMMPTGRRRARRMRGYDADVFGLGSLSDDQLEDMADELGAYDDLPDDIPVGLGGYGDEPWS